MKDPTEPWRLLVMDRDRSTCEAMGSAIGAASDFHVVDIATTVEEARESFAAGDFDFLIVSSHVDASEVLAVSRALREHGERNSPKLVVTGLPDDDATVLNYLEHGVAAFTLGDSSVEGIRLSLRLLARGEALVSMRLAYLLISRLGELAEVARDRGLDPASINDLTPREMDVLTLLDEEITNKEIATRLYVSEGTVKSHVHQILKKLKVRGRDEAVRVFRLHRAADSKRGESGVPNDS